MSEPQVWYCGPLRSLVAPFDAQYVELLESVQPGRVIRAEDVHKKLGSSNEFLMLAVFSDTERSYCVGTMCVSMSGDVGFISDAVVASNWTGRGIEAGLLECAQEWLCKEGVLEHLVFATQGVQFAFRTRCESGVGAHVHSVQ
jgi:hypothetical protein